MTNLTDLEKLEKAATPGPWKMNAFPNYSRGGLTKFIVEYNTLTTSDASFIAALRNAAPHLIAVAKAAAKLAGHGHPHSGACSTDHYVNTQCDCGYEELQNALAAFEAAK